MGKRKHRDKEEHIRRKIRRLEKRLRHSSETSDEYGHRRDYSRTPSRNYTRSPSSEHVYVSDSDASAAERFRSSVTVVPAASPDGENGTTPAGISSETLAGPNATHSAVPSEPGPSTSVDMTNTSTALPEDILQALGDPKGKEEVFGPKIPEEIAKRWGRVLVDGLTREQKQEMMEKTLVPENFPLIKAPLLNPEIASVLGETVKNRDKLLEKAQNHLGLGIAGLTNLASAVIREDMSKIEILKRISEVSQIFLDLHQENTKSRRKLVMSSLDKKFTNIIVDVKRDTYLFGADLGEKIKACKTAERSGLHIKRSNVAAPTSKKYPQQGNWRGPPRTQGQRAHRQGGPKTRYPHQQHRRPPAAAERPPAFPKTNNKPRNH